MTIERRGTKRHTLFLFYTHAFTPLTRAVRFYHLRLVPIFFPLPYGFIRKRVERARHSTFNSLPVCHFSLTKFFRVRAAWN